MGGGPSMKEKKIAEKNAAREIGRTQRYVLIGAAIGLYYGLFYRPTDTSPDYGIAIVLSIVAALVTVAVRFWNKKQPFLAWVKSFIGTFLFYAAILLTLAVRKLAEQIGGRLTVTVATTLIGMALAYALARTRRFS